MKQIVLLLLIVPTLIEPIIRYNKKRKMYYSSYQNSDINKHMYNYIACKLDLLMMLNYKRVSSWMIVDTMYEMLVDNRSKEARLLFIDIEELVNIN